ncbi:MAG: 50S ribosomal protein L13 [Nitrososphaerales archaeon]
MQKTVETHYVDASGQIGGRLCSNVAKLLLNGDRVVVVNAEKVLVSGQRSNVMSGWLEYLKIASVVHPKHGPFHNRTPDGILTRMVRGMVPRRKPSGASAMKRLRVYVGVPGRFEKTKFQRFESAAATKPTAYYVKLGEIASRIGWKGEEN